MPDKNTKPPGPVQADNKNFILSYEENVPFFMFGQVNNQEASRQAMGRP
jgi:hypothetical protein